MLQLQQNPSDFSPCTSEFLHPGSEHSLKLISYYLWCITWTAMLSWQWDSNPLQLWATESQADLWLQRLQGRWEAVEFSNSMGNFSLSQGGSSHTGKTRECWEKREQTEKWCMWKIQEIEYYRGRLIRLCQDFSTLRTRKPLLQVCSVVGMSLYYRTFSNVHGLYPLDARSTRKLHKSKFPSIAKCSMLWSRGMTNSVLIYKSPVVHHLPPWSGLTAFYFTFW